MEYFKSFLISILFILNCEVIHCSERSESKALISKVQKNIICYWQAILPASEIDPDICTHIVYSFIGVTGDGDLNYLYVDKADVESESHRHTKKVTFI